jgi:hypothetical protein
MASWPRFVLVIEIRPPRARPDMPPPAPPVQRLKAALKTLLRAYGVVCVSIEEAPPAGEKAPGV